MKEGLVRKQKTIVGVNFTNETPKEVYRLALLGATNEQMASFLDISVDNFLRLVRDYKRLRTALRRGRMEADSKVAQALYRRAMGYTCKEAHITSYKGEVTITEVEKHYPPDTTAALRWLGTRQKEVWSDTQRVDITQTNINLMKFDFSGLSTDELMLAKKLGLSQFTKDNNAN
jgi:hypothetical protein